MSANASTVSLAKSASEIGWNLLEAGFHKDSELLNATVAQIRQLLERLDEISKGLGERDKAGAAPILAIRPLKRLLANHPPEKCSEVLSRIEPSAQALRGIIETSGNGTQFPPNEVFAAMKVQVANLTGHLSKADM